MKQLITMTLAVLTMLSLATVRAEKIAHEVVPLQVEFSQAELEQMLAPIALYPDTLLSHILIATTYPLEIIQAERWSSRNPDLSSDEISLAIKDKDWDPSVKALLPFPKILQRMSSEIEWTQNLGDAFLQDEARILAGIQTLRLEAENAGNLSDLEHLNVTREQKTIIIEPAQPEVVYVPYYDPRVVYGDWRWSRYPPVYWNYPGYVSYPSPYYQNSLFYWGPSIHLSFGFGFSAFNWHNNHLVVLPYRHHNRHYSRSQIVHHRDHSRWQHNPRHRRGASYRTSSVSNRYHSNRVSRIDNRVARIDRKRNSNSKHRARQQQSRHSKITNNIRKQSRIREPEFKQARLKQKNLSQRIQSKGTKARTNSQSIKRNAVDGRKQKNTRKYATTRSKIAKIKSEPAPRSRAKTQNNGTLIKSGKARKEYRQPTAEYKQPKQNTEYRSSGKSKSSYKEPNRSSSHNSGKNYRSNSKSRSSKSQGRHK